MVHRADHYEGRRPWEANLLLDDGGDLTQRIHDAYPAMLDRIHGISEETTTGVHRLYEMMREGSLKVPAINVNDSVTKSKNDNKYGCRHSPFRRHQARHGHAHVWKEGSGHRLRGRGQGSAQSLDAEKMIVKVTEIDPICGMQACMDGFEVVSPYEGGRNTGQRADIDEASSATRISLSPPRATPTYATRTCWRP